MLSISIYSNLTEDVEKLKSIVQDFLIETKLMAKVSCFNDPNSFILAPCRYDIYIMDMDSTDDVIQLGKEMKEIDTGSHYIYIGSQECHAQKATKARCDYFVSKPIDREDMIDILKEVRQEIKEDSIIIKTAVGERRIRVKHLNYINIVKRCLCYHLTDGAMFDGQTLRSSFEKAVDPLHKNKAFLFIAPSLLINIGEIKEVNKDNIKFENDDILFFPMKHYETVRNTWINYNRIFE